MLLAAVLGNVTIDAQAQPHPFVDAASTVPELVVDMRYAGANNFVGHPVPGYVVSRCWLTLEAARALTSAQVALRHRGLGLKVFDCYRPVSAVRHFVEWAGNHDDQRTKTAFYPRVDKSALLALGYIAARSAHSRGSTVDLTLVDWSDRAERDMGTSFDLFDLASAFSARSLTPAQRRNRQMLRAAMIRAGFVPYAQEWWHFTLAYEPYPDTVFDVPIH